VTVSAQTWFQIWSATVAELVCNFFAQNLVIDQVVDQVRVMEFEH